MELNVYLRSHINWNLLFKLTPTTTIIKLMIGSYVTLLSQELEWLWHFGLVIFYYLIHRNRTLFLLAVNQETKYFAFLLTLKWGLSVSMIIVAPLHNPATSSDFDLKHLLRLGWRNLSKTLEKRSSSPRAAAGVLGDGHVMCRCVNFWLRQEIIFSVAD
jgi:hypothetical protein